MRRQLEEPSPAKLVLAVMWQEKFNVGSGSVAIQLPATSQIGWETVLPELQGVFGKVTEKTQIFEFSAYSPYYEPEMGPELKKCFVEVSGLVSRSSLVELKRKAFALEERFLQNDYRRLNVDPMLVTMENVVISTSKNFSHRIYLGQGVFSDLALIYQKHNFESLPWTYPDYTDHIPFFREVRHKLQAELRARSTGSSGQA